MKFDVQERVDEVTNNSVSDEIEASVMEILKRIDPNTYGIHPDPHTLTSINLIKTPEVNAKTLSTDRSFDLNDLNIVLLHAMKCDYNHSLSEGFVCDHKDKSAPALPVLKFNEFYSMNTFKYSVFFVALEGLISDTINDPEGRKNVDTYIRRVREVAARFGLMKMAVDAKAVNEQLILKSSAKDHRVSAMPLLLGNCMTGFLSMWSHDLHIDCLALASARQFYGFLTRFVPEGITAYPNECIEKFKGCNDAMMDIERQFSTYICGPVIGTHFERIQAERDNMRMYNLLKDMRMVLHHVLDEDCHAKVCKALSFVNDIRENARAVYLPSGADYEKHKTYANKLISVMAHFPNYIQVPINVAMDSTPEEIPVRFSSVPKDSGASRGIGVTPCWCNVLGKQIVAALEDEVKCRTYNAIDFHHAEYNVEALSVDLCTMDFSSASDTNSNYLVHLLYPTWFTELVDLCRPSYVEFRDGTRQPLNIYLMMGHTVTCIVQSLYYWAVMVASSFQYELETEGTSHLKSSFMSDSSLWVKHWAPKLHAYNDDIEFPVVIYDHVLWSTKAIGLRVNESKTFSGKSEDGCYLKYFSGCTYFRESCGSERYATIDKKVVTCEFVKFPRQGMPNDLYGLRSAIAVQHNLFDYKFYSAAENVGRYLRQLFPELTESDGVDGYEDIWTLSPIQTTHKFKVPLREGDGDAVVGYLEAEEVLHTHFVRRIKKASNVKVKCIEAGADLAYVLQLKGLPKTCESEFGKHNVGKYFCCNTLPSGDPSYFRNEGKPDNLVYETDDTILGFDDVLIVDDIGTDYVGRSDDRHLVYDPVAIVDDSDPTSEPNYIRKSEFTSEDYELVMVNKA